MDSNSSVPVGCSTVATAHDASQIGLKSAHRYQLVVVEGTDMGRAATLGAEELIVGTDPACELALSDQRVSRRHAALSVDAHGFAVRDLASRNGTVYAGSTISEAVVPLGATLKLGTPSCASSPPPNPRGCAEPGPRVRGVGRREPRDARGVCVLELAAPIRRHAPAPGGDGHRQGAGRARCARDERPSVNGLRRARLRCAAREPARKRAFRPQAGCLHRRHRRPQGRLCSCQMAARSFSTSSIASR
jgi:hypothetical protein